MAKSFLNISDFSKQQILEILNSSIKDYPLKDKSIGLIFEKYSTRTRLSFNVGIQKLGGSVIDIQFENLNIQRSETFEDTFKAIDCYLDGLVYRTTDHRKLIEISKYFSKPIINALSDLSHPCQILSDLLTMKEIFGNLDIHILWMGDMNNVCYSLVEAVNLFPELNLTICSPKEINTKVDWKINKNIKIISNINEISMKTVKCVMTDVFISMNDKDSIDKIKKLRPYIVTKDLMSQTSTDSIFMHCLPAKVGQEVSKDVFYSDKSIVWKQAYNRMIAQNKLLQFIYK